MNLEILSGDAAKRRYASWEQHRQHKEALRNRLSHPRVSAFERYLIQLLESLLLPSDVAQTLLHLPQQGDGLWDL